MATRLHQEHDLSSGNWRGRQPTSTRIPRIEKPPQPYLAETSNTFNSPFREKKRHTKTSGGLLCEGGKSLSPSKDLGGKTRRIGGLAFRRSHWAQVLGRRVGLELGGRPVPRWLELYEKTQEIKQKLEDGSSIDDIADEYFPIWVRYHRAFDRYVTMKTAPRHHECTVHVLFGPTGTGKSKWVMDNYPVAYWKQRSKWWCGYSAHKTVVMDEFYGWLPFDLLLRLCDRYPMLVESKGGQLQFVAGTIIFTTNKSPDEWYANCYFPALRRRVAKWHYLPSLGFHSIYSNFDEFKNAINP